MQQEVIIPHLVTMRTEQQSRVEWDEGSNTCRVWLSETAAKNLKKRPSAIAERLFMHNSDYCNPLSHANGMSINLDYAASPDGCRLRMPANEFPAWQERKVLERWLANQDAITEPPVIKTEDQCWLKVNKDQSRVLIHLTKDAFRMLPVHVGLPLQKEGWRFQTTGRADPDFGPMSFEVTERCTNEEGLVVVRCGEVPFGALKALKRLLQKWNADYWMDLSD